MEYVIICGAALLGSGLTFFSGFGLGTILVPVFSIFFNIELAIALTAVVHLLNNLFKLVLVGKNINRSVLLKFGLPSVPAAFAGAYLLTKISNDTILASYSLFGNGYEIKLVNLIIALLLVFFSLFELLPKWKKISFGANYLPLGGVLSGFFGGLSGNQGALRSAFLLRLGLDKNAFIATGVVIACTIDVSRLSIYAGYFFSTTNIDYLLLSLAVFSAFIGAYFGNKLLQKVTIEILQNIVAFALLVFALMLGAGFI